MSQYLRLFFFFFQTQTYKNRHHVSRKRKLPAQDMRIPQGPRTLFLIFVYIPFFIFLVIALRAVACSADPKPLLFLLGGLVSIVFEPIVDVLGFCYFPLTANGSDSQSLAATSRFSCSVGHRVPRSVSGG
jgi:hypothetical protein